MYLCIPINPNIAKQISQSSLLFNLFLPFLIALHKFSIRL
ncbi:hypothetical protein VCRA2110O319_10089 [Vibrio crassostreae]|nr:hypothetical protein VCRA2110O319_10089 [Vibrio crassostreae]CAK3402157.1 hypothetical protein VCRA2120O9_20087 [Vibrio crassostreae]CAK3512464.1 hypothetical protein VCRA2126E14_20280 [Vibrio crassostreae]